LKRIVDLTHDLHSRMPGVKIDSKHIIKKHAWNTTTLHLYSHAGTHMDSPKHFINSGNAIDKIALEKCVGPARVIDLRYIKPQESITANHLKPYADKIAAGDRILLKTGWSAHIDLPDYRSHFPTISLSLAKWFSKKKIALIGVEPPSVADLNNTKDTIAVHKVLLKAEIVIVEGLNNLGALKTDLVTLIALSLKVKGGDGSPARVIAIEEII
jgi:kynurenine formamidase